MPQDTLMVIMAETNERLRNARVRRAPGEIKWLEGVKEALGILQGLLTNAAREADRLTAQAKRDAAASPPMTGHDL